jgi:hypothetical protein|tara:strand:- start:399 stop:782 length:384 start_codon:yes stop_codon:yes gene_type:complete
MSLELELSAENWEKVAKAVGDDNPIHYREHNKNPVCPGIYLFSDAEKKYRERFEFSHPMQIKGKFYSPSFQETLNVNVLSKYDSLNLIYLRVPILLQNLNLMICLIKIVFLLQMILIGKLVQLILRD